MIQSDNISILNKTKSKLPSLPFVSIKEKILGGKYELDIVFLTAKEQAKLNKVYRGKEGTTNILSFPISKQSGQITLDIAKIRKEYHLFNMNFNTFLKFLLIHGCLHLKGFEHSSRMEREEQKFLKMFS